MRLQLGVEELLGAPPYEGNAIDVYRNGDEIFPAMLECISSAERTVEFLTFVYWTGDIAREFAHRLAERARAGVDVRVLVDAVGGRTMSSELVALMEDAGVSFRWFRPLTRMRRVGNRTHRKVLVCDERVAFTGGVGIAEEWCGDARDPSEWRDTHFRVRGPAVAALRAAFATNWFESVDDLDGKRLVAEHRAEQVGDVVVQVLRSQPTYVRSDIGLVLMRLVALAEERLLITTPYFTPDETFVEMLVAAADRGVEVQVLVPGEHIDKRVVQVAAERHYESLLDAGVALHIYDRTMLHAKSMVIDGVSALVGSANINRRSMDHDDELGLLIHDEDVARTLEGHFADDLEHSHRLEKGEWAERGPARRAVEAVVGLGRKFL
jgi:cardiolipin synthase